MELARRSAANLLEQPTAKWDSRPRLQAAMPTCPCALMGSEADMSHRGAISDLSPQADISPSIPTTESAVILAAAAPEIEAMKSAVEDFTLY
jgi:hypothetical protein